MELKLRPDAEINVHPGSDPFPASLVIRNGEEYLVFEMSAAQLANLAAFSSVASLIDQERRQQWAFGNDEMTCAHGWDSRACDTCNFEKEQGLV